MFYPQRTNFVTMSVVFFFTLSSLVRAQENLPAVKKEVKNKPRQQAFLSPSPVVLPPVTAPLGQSIPVTASPLEIQPVESPLTEKSIPAEIIPQQSAIPVTSSTEQTEPLEQIIQQKIEKPIQSPTLPKESEPLISEKPLTVPLPGRRVPIQPVPKVTTRTLEPVIVTATKTPVPASQLASASSVITGEYLENHRIQFIGDALRQAPGVAVRQLGGPGRQTNLFIRGGSDGQAVVMIDGVKVNSPTSGDYNFANLTTNQIDRIEIIRGPQSTLYGSQAMSGVVNVITKQATKQPRFSTQVEYGTFDTRSGSLTLSDRFQKGDYSLSVSRIRTDGISQNDGFENNTVASRFGLDLNEETRIDTTYRLNAGLVNIDKGAYRPDPNSYSRVRQHIAQTSIRSRLSDRWEQKLSGSLFHDVVFNLNASDPGTTQKDSLFKLDSDVYTMEWQHNYQLTDANLVTAGYEWRQTTANNKSFDQTAQNHGFYFQDQVSIAERWFLTGGVRVDNNEDYGKAANPRFAIARLWPETATKIKGSIGTAFKAPTLNQLYFPGFGNPNLAPEKLFGYDAGLEQRFLSDKVTIGLTYFHNRYRNLLENRAKPGGGTEPVNIGVAKTEGIEWETGYQLMKDLTLSGHYDFLVAKDLTTGAPLRRRPKHSGGISLGYTGWNRWGLHLNTTFVGRRQDDVSAPGWPTRMTNPGYKKVDLVASYEYKPGKKLYSKVENLTNSHYDEVLGFGTQGTTFSIGSQADF